MTKVLDAAWHTWIDDNLARGCDKMELREILFKEGFSQQQVDKAIAPQHFLNPIKKKQTVKQELADRHDGADYKALANISVVNSSKPQITPFDNSLIQLFQWDDFLSADECEKLLAIIGDNLRPSTVTQFNGDDAFRTSSTCDLSLLDNEFIKQIDQKIAAALGINRSYSEGIQAQRYQVGQQFKAHTDYFEPHTNEYLQFAQREGQRTWTFMIYLQDTPKGGGTKFVDLRHTFYPKAGQAVIWNNLDENGFPNPHTIHHGMPVEEGEKIIITKWFRAKGEGEMFEESKR